MGIRWPWRKDPLPPVEGKEEARRALRVVIERQQVTDETLRKRRQYKDSNGFGRDILDALGGLQR